MGATSSGLPAITNTRLFGHLRGLAVLFSDEKFSVIYENPGTA